MDRATSERPEMAAEGRIAMAHVMSEEATDGSPLARLTAKMRKEAAKKAMRTIQRKAMERQAEQLIRAPSVATIAAPAKQQQQHYQHPKSAAAAPSTAAASAAAEPAAKPAGKRNYKKPQGGAGQGAERAQASSDA